MLEQATAGGQTVQQWLQAQGGRVFTELHLQQDVQEALKRLRRLRNDAAWKRSGCRIFVFTFLRCVRTGDVLPYACGHGRAALRHRAACI